MISWGRKVAWMENTALRWRFIFEPKVKKYIYGCFFHSFCANDFNNRRLKYVTLKNLIFASYWGSPLVQNSKNSFGYVDSYAKIFLILHTLFENSTIRIAITCAVHLISAHTSQEGKCFYYLYILTMKEVIMTEIFLECFLHECLIHIHIISENTC